MADQPWNRIVAHKKYEFKMLVLNVSDILTRWSICNLPMSVFFAGVARCCWVPDRQPPVVK